MNTVIRESLSAWWPEVWLSVGGLLAMVLGVWGGKAGAADGRGARAAATVSWLSLLAAAVALWRTPEANASSLFFGLIVCDPISLPFRWLALGAVAVTMLLIAASKEMATTPRGEAYGLLGLIGVGLMLMAEASHLLMAYVALELVSLASYVLVGFLEERRSAEASLKYLLFGATASGVMLFGMSLLFGLTSSLSFSDILLSVDGMHQPLAGAVLLAVLLMLVGLAFKISMVPFHQWTPDAYEGAPVAVAAFLSVGPKAAGLALLLRLMGALEPVWPMVAPVVLGLTIVTMTLGNLVALVQTNVKRLLAYSTIGQVGYLLIGFVVHTDLGIEAMMLYLIAYFFMNFGAFACVVAVVNDSGSEALEAFRGLGRRSPVLALLCTLFLLSLAGIPPLLGFFGKFLLFGSAIAADHTALALAGILNSAIALYYYVNLVRLMYFVEPQRAGWLQPPPMLRVTLGVCAAMTLGLGLFPDALLQALRAVVSANLL